jgi:hypothetical protein
LRKIGEKKGERCVREKRGRREKFFPTTWREKE